MDLHIFDKDLKEQTNKNKIFIGWDSEEINTFLENNKKELRLKYLNIIHSIISKNSSKFKYLKLKEVNLLKMSLINEKNPFKSEAIFDCLKLLTIELIVKKKKIKNIFYHGKKYNLDKSLKNFCSQININYYKKKLIFFNSNFKFVFFLKGSLFFIIQFIKNFKLKSNLKKFSTISIFSYFVHLKSVTGSKFNSNLWGNLTKYLNSKKKNINWFHFYVPSNQIKKAQIANLMQKKFNLNKYENHNFINSFLTNLNFIKSYYFFLIFCSRNFFSTKVNYNFFQNKFSKTNFYFFLKEDFFSSLFGVTLIYNIMNILTFDKLLKEIPRQKYGIYIIENQSWEYCFIKLWKKYNHGKIIAYFNSSIRFWDLRYLKKKNEFYALDENPDLYLINSKIFKLEAKKIGYPLKKLFLVEALRYNKLTPALKIKKNRKILIVGDILFNQTDNLLKFINKITVKLNSYKFYLKPHPTMTYKSINIFKTKYPYLKITSINSDKFKNFEFVICSNGTSANLDCLAQRLNFCSIKPYNSLNLYPIEKYQKIFQVKDHKDLINRIKKPQYFKDIKIFEKAKNLNKIQKILNKI